MAKYCPNCGTELKEGQEVCLNCGKVLKKEEPQNNNVNNNKSKVAAGLLGIFLGSLGIHNFYLGYNGKAVTQLLLTVLSCGILSPISGIWGLVEGILILSGNINKDSEGNPLSE